ncbi:MAG: hypothetical protein IPF59_02490 [Ignavibacteria bacterium]|nr:hypothetical protein [Ignavibacteria bacterium]
MLHPTISERYVQHRRVYARLLRLAFTLAGLYWFVIYTLPLEQHMSLRAGQSMIYFILMTLWGLDYMREQRRLTVIIEAANGKGLPPDQVTFSDVARHESLFSMFVPRRGFWGTVVPMIFTLGLPAALILVVLQYVRVFAAF